MEFTAEQQAFIDTMINKRVAEIKSKAEKEAKDGIDAAVAAAEARFKEQTAIKDKELADLKAKVAGGDRGGEDLTAMKERVAALEADKVKSRDLARKAQLLTAASELGAVNGEQAAVLVSPFIKSGDDGQLSVVNPEGQTRLNAEGKPMTVKEFMTEFLTGNPHLVKAGGQTGAGSRGAMYENGRADMAALSKLPPIERINAARKAGIK